MLEGLVLLYVGAMLILNGLWMLGRIDDREIALINLFSGGISLLAALKLRLRRGRQRPLHPCRGADTAVFLHLSVGGVQPLQRGRRTRGKVTACLAIVEGVVTGWIPGYLLLTGVLPSTPY